MDVEVQAIQVGPAVFLAEPGEIFCQLGLDIKSGSPFQFTFPVELANDCVGYVPTEEALGPAAAATRRGSPLQQPGTGRRHADGRAALELARQMKPGAVPEPRKAPPFREPWSYGNVPPEV